VLVGRHICRNIKVSCRIASLFISTHNLCESEWLLDDIIWLVSGIFLLLRVTELLERTATAAGSPFVLINFRFDCLDSKQCDQNY
jgi:hypothetical protein